MATTPLPQTKAPWPVTGKATHLQGCLPGGGVCHVPALVHEAGPRHPAGRLQLGLGQAAPWGGEGAALIRGLQTVVLVVGLHSCQIFYFYLYVNFREDIDSEEPHVLSTGDTTFLYIFKLTFSSSFNILFIFITAEFIYLSVLAFFT